MALRTRFIMVLVLTLLVPLLLSQALLLWRFFGIQEDTHRNHLHTLAKEVYENLQSSKHEAMFSSKLIATSTVLDRYINSERYRLPESVAYRALLKSMAVHLQTHAAFRSIYFVKPDGHVDIQFDLLGTLTPLDRLPDITQLQQAIQQKAFYWYSTQQEPEHLRLMVAHAVSNNDSTEVSRRRVSAIAGYIVINVSLESLKYFDLPLNPVDRGRNHQIVLRHRDTAHMHTPAINETLFQQLRNTPATAGKTMEIGGETYLIERDTQEPDITIEAWTSLDTLYRQVTPAMLQNFAISLVQVILVGLLFYFILDHWLITPLQNAQSLTRKLRRGEWLQRPEPLGSHPAQDEVSRLLDGLYDLSDALQHTTHALENKREQAELAERLKTEFLANISHEIRTPVNVIVGIMTRLEKSLSEPRQKDALGMAKNEALRLVKEIDELILLADLEAHKHTPVVAEFYLPDLLQRCLANAWPIAQQKGLSLVLKAASNTDGIVAGDNQKLAKIIDILLENAVKFTSKGGITFEASCDSAPDQTQRLTVSIIDTGPGIAANAIPLLGQAFRQLDGSHARQHGGLGMGLAICRSMLTLLGGELQIDSVQDQGSTFRIMVPLRHVNTSH